LDFERGASLPQAPKPRGDSIPSNMETPTVPQTHFQHMTRFPPDDQQLLMSERGINAVVIARLEQAGYCSITQLVLAGVPAAVEDVCRLVGSVAWANRRKALERAVRKAAARQRALLDAKQV
jgi:hypothetical protein